MSLSPIITQTERSSYTTSETEKTQSGPFDKAIQSLSLLFKRIQESSSLESKKTDLLQLHHEISFLRNASLQDRREVLAANQHLAKQELEQLEISLLQRGREMDAQIDAHMQQATELLDNEIKTQLSLHPQGARKDLLAFYEAARKVQRITSPQTEFERNWDFAKCLHEEGKLSESVAIIKEIPLPEDVQKLFDSIKDSPTQEKLEQFFQAAKCAKTKNHIKTVSNELNRPKILADVLAHPTIMEAFLKYVNPVTLMRLNSSYHESVKQVLPRTYAETYALNAKNFSTFSLSSAPVACRNLIPTALAALWQNGLEYEYLDPRLQNDVGIAKIALISIVQKGITVDFEKLVSLFPEHIKTQLAEYIPYIKNHPIEYKIEPQLLYEFGFPPFTKYLAQAFIIANDTDKDIYLVLTKITGELLYLTNIKLRNDPEIVMLAVQEHGFSLFAASEELQDNDAIVMTAVQQNGDALGSASMRLKDTEAIVMSALKQNGIALKFASDRLRNNEEFVKVAIAQNALSLQYAGELLKDSDEIVMAAVKEHGDALCFASERLQNTEEIVSVAVTQYGRAFQYASERLKNTDAIVSVAVTQYGSAFQYASDRLKDDESFVMDVVSRDSYVLEHVSDRLKDNKEIVRTAVTRSGLALQYASGRLKDDEEIVRTAVMQNAFSLQYASKRFQDNDALVMAAVTQIGHSLQYASERLKNKKEIVMTAVTQSGRALPFIGKQLANDPEIIIAAFKQLLTNEYNKDWENLVIIALEASGELLELASSRLKDTKAIVMKAVSQDGNALRFASDRIKDSEDIVRAAIAQNASALEFASERLREKLKK